MRFFAKLKVELVHFYARIQVKLEVMVEYSKKHSTTNHTIRRSNGKRWLSSIGCHQKRLANGLKMTEKA